MPERRATVLCIDDHELGLLTRRLLLESEGYAVLTASTASEGRRLFACATVDLVITDYYLPDGRGSDIARSMKALRPHVPILLLSGSVDQPDSIGGADVFLSKVTDVATMLSVIRDLLTRRSAAVA